MTSDNTLHESTAKRFVLLVEMPLPKGWSSRGVEGWLREAMEDNSIIVWGALDGVDGAYRKLRQLSAETEQEDTLDNRVHSAHKAMSFFRDMFPAAFWRWKRIGEPHPTADERPMMAGR